MHIDFRPFIVLGVILFAVVGVLAFYRKSLSRGEDDQLHVFDGGGANQPVLAHKLDQIDKWGKLLTIIAVVYGVIVGVAYVYQSYLQSTTSTGL